MLLMHRGVAGWSEPVFEELIDVESPAKALARTIENNIVCRVRRSSDPPFPSYDPNSYQIPRLRRLRWKVMVEQGGRDVQPWQRSTPLLC